MLRAAVMVVADPAPRSRSNSSSSLSATASLIGGVGIDKLIYFRAGDPAIFIAPDAFVKLGSGVVVDDADSWKTWERGAPEVAFEILSPTDSGEPQTLDAKVALYNELGVRELIVFDVDDPPGHRLRVWDRVDGDFVERIVEEERTPCITLNVGLKITPILLDKDVEYPACLRLVREADGNNNDVFVPTTHEARIAVDDARRAETLARQTKEAAEQAAADASMAGAQSQRAEAQARGDAEAETRLAELERARARAGR
jgi:hypothetical protein